MTRSIDVVGVVGLGTMGAGIAEVFARHGADVVAVELDPAALERGRGHVDRSTGRAVDRGKLSVIDRQALFDRLSFNTSLDALADVDLVIEAVPERLEIKRSLFAALDQLCQPAAILATNTSSLSITEIAAATTRPGRVIGLHFFNPAPVMKLVEIVHSVLTDPDVIADVRDLAHRLGKTGVSVGDRAGFVANRLLFGYLNQAAGMLESRWASREDIDLAMTVGAGLPMGPLTLLDLIGLDTSVQILDTIYAETHDRRHATAPILRQFVAAGFLGRKSGRGLYDYRAEPGPSDGAPDYPARLRVGAVVDPSSALPGWFEVGGRDVVRADPAELAPSDAPAGAGRSDGPAGSDATEGPAGPAGPSGLAECDVIIDLAGDDGAGDRFGRLGRLAGPGAVLVTTSPTRPVLEFAISSGAPERVVGLHVIERPKVDRTDARALGEVVVTVATSDDAVARAEQAAAELGLSTVRSPDRAGRIVDALLLPHLNDAVAMIGAGYATADDIDAAMRFGCGYPVGPIERLDAIGLDVVLRGLDTIYAEQREPGLAPAALLRQLVNAGRIGRGVTSGVRSAD